MRTNVTHKTPVFTHEGVPSTAVPPLQQLRRLSMACLLWEDTFYVDGKKHIEILDEVCQKISGDAIVKIALESHQKGLLRHLPLFLIVQALKRGAKCVDAIDTICNRPDQICELLSLYSNGDPKKLRPCNQLKKGIAKAFLKFDEYQLAKYNRDNPIKLRDVAFLCHVKAGKNKQQGRLFANLVNKDYFPEKTRGGFAVKETYDLEGKPGLKTPETWETKLSAGENKKDTFQELLEKGKMGKLALVRNLRNMQESGVSQELVERELMKKGRPILPFTFLAAAKNCPKWEPMIDKAMIASLQNHDKLDGVTVVFVDVSGSMDQGMSNKSEIKRMDAACAIAILLREICETVDFFSFSHALASVPPRQGMALRDAIVNSQPHSGTMLGGALNAFKSIQANNVSIKRLIVITDEQTGDMIPYMNAQNCYIINIGSYQNGIQNKGQWLTVTGFSEHVIDYIREVEKDCNSDS